MSAAIAMFYGSPPPIQRYGRPLTFMQPPRTLAELLSMLKLFVGKAYFQARTNLALAPAVTPSLQLATAAAVVMPATTAPSFPMEPRPEPSE